MLAKYENTVNNSHLSYVQVVKILLYLQYTLEMAKQTYGCNVIEVALAHRAVCKALLVLQNFEEHKYHYHATEALKMARSILPSQHPMLYLFLHTSGKYCICFTQVPLPRYGSSQDGKVHSPFPASHVISLPSYIR